MGQRAKDLAERLQTFNNEVIAFVENCPAEEWNKVCPWEDWSVGVVARHIGAGHYQAMGLAKMMVSGDKLPHLTEGQFVQAANEHARKHAGCAKAEVLDILRQNGKAMVDFVGKLKDGELDRTGYLAAIGGELNVQQFIEAIIIQSGGEHFANMKSAVAE